MANTTKPIVGVFSEHAQAQKAVRGLKDAGFTDEQIGVASSNRNPDSLGKTSEDEAVAGEGALGGAATGAAAGAGLGALWGLGILAGVLPAIGPAIAGGTLAMLLSSAAAGAAAAGLAGALIGMGFSKEDAEYYESEMKSGRTIVTVDAGSRRADAVRIIRQFGGYDRNADGGLQDRGAATVVEAGGSTVTGTACPSGTGGFRGVTGSTDAGQTLQAHEERLNVQKKPVKAGEVKIRKEVHTEHKTIDVPVTREEVVIERRPATGQEVSASGLGAGQEIRIPVREEQVNVEKQTVVAEEVTVGKRRVQNTKHVDEQLRKENIKVETTGDVDVRERRS